MDWDLLTVVSLASQESSIKFILITLRFQEWTSPIFFMLLSLWDWINKMTHFCTDFKQFKYLMVGHSFVLHLQCTGPLRLWHLWWEFWLSLVHNDSLEMAYFQHVSIRKWMMFTRSTMWAQITLYTVLHTKILSLKSAINCRNALCSEY